MSNNTTTHIEYLPGTTIGAFDEIEYQRFLNWIKTGDRPDLTFDPDYIEHLRLTNGGIPKLATFLSSSGRERLIMRMFHFFDTPIGHPLHDSHVEIAHTQAGDSGAFDILLIPFADLFAGDMLCFDYRDMARVKPTVVIWLHEESEPDAPATEFVADSFRDFVKMLF